ncbi:MAG TPA: adenylate kinase [Bacteroidales bacterium]|nr:adenylate kinase [Bacteroidales bacterium]
MLNLLLFGPPGAGKGTQSNNLFAKYNLVHFSTGESLRDEMAANSAIGKEAKVFLDRAEYVPDELILRIVKKKLIEFKHENGIIFDGFPRTKAQAEALDILMQETLNSEINCMLALDVPDDKLVERMQERGIKLGRYEDQTEELIRKRLKIYKCYTEPVAEYYKKCNKFIAINGVGSVEQIFNRITSVIEEKI